MKKKRKGTKEKTSGFAVVFALCVLLTGFAVWMPLQAHAGAAMTDVTYERVVAHGGGAIDGYETTNSKEAVENAISNGFKNIELDFAMSSDGKVVAVHDWESQAVSYFGVASTARVTAEQFSKLLIYEKYHTLTFDDVAAILRANPEISIITDTKEDNLTILKAIASAYPDVIKQVYPQIYSYDEYDAVAAMGYKRIILTLYKISDSLDSQTLLNYVLNRPLMYAVTMNIELKDKGYATMLMNNGIVVYTHPVNDFSQALADRKQGCFGVYTDTLMPSDFSDFNMNFYPASTVNGVKVKLEDQQTDQGTVFVHVKSNGTGAEYVKLKIDGQYVGISDPVQGDMKRILSGSAVISGPSFPVGRTVTILSSDIPQGISRLTVEIYNSSEGFFRGSRDDYYIGRYGDNCRLVSQAFKYRVDQMRKEIGISALAEATNSSQAEALDILSNSFIARAGDYRYYNCGEPGRFDVNGNYVYARQTANVTYADGTTQAGFVMLPLSCVGSALGITKISMDGVSMVIKFFAGNKWYSTGIGSRLLNEGSSSVQLAQGSTLFNNKFYMTVSAIGYIIGRQVVESDGCAVILPEGMSVNDVDPEQIIKCAKALYE